MSDKLYTISLKGAASIQPWLVINADNADEALDAISNAGVEVTMETTLLQAIAEANAHFQGVLNVSNPHQAPAQSAPPAVQGAAQSAPQNTGGGQPQQTSYGRRKASAGTGGRGGKSDRLAPGVVPEPCQHGPRTYREGNGAKGFWSAYFCPSPKGTVDQCDPLWIDND